jgi:hypothetical protein
MLRTLMPGGESFFGAAFWQQLLATLVGVVVGIPIALWLSRQQERREARAASGAREGRRQQLLTAVKNEVQSNRDALRTIAQAIESGRIEAAPLWMSVLEGTAAIKYELLEVPLCEAGERTRGPMKDQPTDWRSVSRDARAVDA